MTKDDLFGKTIQCACGRTHQIEPREVVYAEDALSRLPAVCGRATAGRRAAVLMDVRTRAAAGLAVAEALRSAGWQVSELLVPDPADGSWPVCDEATKVGLADRLPAVDLMLPVGSGVICDLGKWLAYGAGVGFVSFATAASMNGYTSANVAPSVGGVKTLLRAWPPAAVVAAPAVLRDAPFELTAAGLGDVLAKSVSSADWFLNHLLFNDYYCQKAVGLIAEIEPTYFEQPQAIRDRKTVAIEALFHALLLTGVAMTMAETSAPASGGEHLISHALDMMSTVDGERHDLHGRQVGVGAVLTAELYRRVLAVESPPAIEPAEAIDRRFWGPLADAVAEQYAEKLPRLRQARESLQQAGLWDDLRGRLAPMLRRPEQIQDCLRRAGAAHRAEDIGSSRARVLAAFLHAHEMRSRFTILDLAYLAGVMPAAAFDIVSQWA